MEQFPSQWEIGDFSPLLSFNKFFWIHYETRKVHNQLTIQWKEQTLQ